MEQVNKELKKYIVEEVFPVYENNDSGHNLEHIKYVINRSIKFASQFENINLDMVYTIAAFHDIAHHIDKDHHEVKSAEWFYKDENMKRFFTDEERQIIKEAIEDHRASSKTEPRTNYGKIVSSADRNVDVSSMLKRMHSYTCQHYNNLSLEEAVERAYKHMMKKYGVEGYAKNYCVDKEYLKFKEEVKDLIKDKKAFEEKYLQVNNLEK